MSSLSANFDTKIGMGFTAVGLRVARCVLPTNTFLKLTAKAGLYFSKLPGAKVLPHTDIYGWNCRVSRPNGHLQFRLGYKYPYRLLTYDASGHLKCGLSADLGIAREYAAGRVVIDNEYTFFGLVRQLSSLDAVK
jgi:hypothetical protein